MSLPHFRATLCRVLWMLLVISLIIPFSAGIALALDNGDCHGCHGDNGILQWSPQDRASNVVPGGPRKPQRLDGKFPGMSLHVDPEAYKTSVHGDLACTDCHADIKSLPHTASLARVNCSGCHAGPAAEYAKSRHVLAFRGKRVANPPTCADCHGAHAIPPASDNASPVSFRNVASTCGRCHGTAIPAGQVRTGIGMGPAKMYSQSVHNQAVEKGMEKAASCVSCHGSHGIKDRQDPASSIYAENVPATCGKCHFDMFTLYKDSVHGTALSRGVPDAPNCATCHGEHNIRAVREPATGALSGPGASCADCHRAEKLAARYGIPAGKVEGYEQSFHGLSARLGDKTVAACASCHGNHEIFPSSDPRSTVHPKNIPVTCGKCHPGATENFAKGNVHSWSGGPGNEVKLWVRRFYIWLIVLVIGAMLAHNGMDFYRKMKEIYRRRQVGDEPTYERLNASERVQHLLTLTSFIALAITGFALMFNWPVPFVSAQAGVYIRSWGHRIAAIVMTAVSLYHVYYAIFTPRGRGHLVRMIPRWKDAEDIWGTVRYFLGQVDHKPKFERFSYVEKAEYLALVWGTVVMIVTGIMLWFEEETLQVLPLWGLDVVTIIHYYEAILATLAIVVWHFYYVFMNPDFAPMSLTWIDGKLTRREMEHEHALELEEIESYEAAKETPPPDVTRVVRGPQSPHGGEKPPEDEGQG